MAGIPYGGAGSRPEADHSRSSCVMFWFLLLLGMSTLAPCILLPEWRRYEELHLAAQWQDWQVACLRGEVERTQRELSAMRTDPVAMQRLARREGWVPPESEFSVYVPAVPAVSPEGLAPALRRPRPPEWVIRLRRALPDYDYVGLFCAEPARTVLMVLSVGLILLAFTVGGGWLRASEADGS